MATPFRLKRSAISGKRPLIGDLELGELALNFYDGYLFARRDTGGVGIADTVSLLNPWTENFGGNSIFYEQSVGIGTTSPTETLTVFGNSYVSGNFNTKTLTASTVTSNNGIFTSFSATGVSTFSGDLDINAAIDVDGHTELDELRVSGVATFVGVTTFIDSNVYIDNELFVGGIQITGGTGGGSSFAGIVTFSDTTNNTLGDADTGAVQIDGGLGVNKNVTVGAGLSIGATLNVAGVTTFQGDVLLDGSNTDLVVEGTIRTPNLHNNGADLSITGGGTGATRQSIILPNSTAHAIQILGNSSGTGGITLDTRNSGNILLKHNTVTKLTVDSTGIEVNGHSELDTVRITGLSTFTKDLDINAAIDVDGHTELDNLNVSGIATFASLDVQTNFDVYDSTATFHNNVHITGNLSIGGTTTVLQAQDLKIFDKDIILGVTTDSNGEDISTDITANHAGVAVASTEGYPLVDLYLEGLEELPTTYKKIMWFSEGSFSGLGTDAWLFNYAIGIGSTQFPTGTRLAVGEIQLTDTTISVPQLSISDTTNNTLGDSNTGAVKIDGGLGVDKNVTVGGNLNVQGYSNFIGVVTFSGGTINIGDANTDDVNVGGEFISSLIPNDDDSYDLGSDSKQWRNIYINGQAEIDDLNVSGITTTVEFNVGVGGTIITTTETGLVGINSTSPTTTLDVGGTINSNTDVTINGTSVLTTAENDAVALAIALG